MARPLIIQYTNLLHQYRDPAAPAVKAFVAEHAKDKVFVRRTKALNRVFQLKRELETSSVRSPVQRNKLKANMSMASV